MFGLDLPSWSDVLAWAIRSDVTGILQWLGTLLAVVGIPLTYRQSWKAAVASEEAAKAVASFRLRSNSINVAHSYSHLELARGFISSADYKAAQTVVGILKRDVVQTIGFLKNSADQPDNLSTARRNIKTIEIHIARASRSDETFNMQVLDKAINGLSDCLLEWENRFVTTLGN